MLASEDADALSQPLHLMVLRQTGATQVPFCRCVKALGHKLIPARVVTLMRDISLAHLSLQLSEVKPRLVLLGREELG